MRCPPDAPVRGISEQEDDCLLRAYKDDQGAIVCDIDCNGSVFFDRFIAPASSGKLGTACCAYAEKTLS